MLSYYLSYTFRGIDTLFLVLVYLSYTFLFHILYLFIYFSFTVLCTFLILSYTILCPFHILSCTMYFSYTAIFYILSSCTLLLVLVTVYYHRIAVLCFSYHVIYSIHFICIYLCGPAFFTRMRPHSMGETSLLVVIVCWKTILIKRFGVATYFCFIFKGKTK